MSSMMHQFSAVCKDCTLPFTVERKSKRGKPSTRCPECQTNHRTEYLKATVRNDSIAAHEMLRLIDKRHNMLATDRQQAVLNALVIHIINNVGSVPLVLRRALTLGAPRLDANGNVIPDFANHFFAFCKEVYGIKPSAILKKNKSPEEVQDLEGRLLASARIVQRNSIAPFIGSVIDFLTGADDSALPQPADHSYLITGDKGKNLNWTALENFGDFKVPRAVARDHLVNESRYVKLVDDNEVEF